MPAICLMLFIDEIDTTLIITDRSGLLKRNRDIYRGSLMKVCTICYVIMPARDYTYGTPFEKMHKKNVLPVTACCTGGCFPRSKLTAFFVF